MITIVLFSILEMLLTFDPLWVLLDRLPPKYRLRSIEIVYVGDGYILLFGGGAGDIE